MYEFIKMRQINVANICHYHVLLFMFVCMMQCPIFLFCQHLASNTAIWLVGRTPVTLLFQWVRSHNTRLCQPVTNHRSISFSPRPFSSLCSWWCGGEEKIVCGVTTGEDINSCVGGEIQNVWKLHRVQLYSRYERGSERVRVTRSVLQYYIVRKKR